MSLTLPTTEARRASHQRIKPKISKLHVKVIFFINEYYIKHGLNPTTRQLANFSGIDILTTGARLSELRNEHGLIISEVNPKGNKYGSLNKLTELARMMVQAS